MCKSTPSLQPSLSLSLSLSQSSINPFVSLSLSLSRFSLSTMASDLEVKAKEAFVEDHFELAVELLSQAITLDPLKPEFYADRAQAHIKLNNFTGKLSVFL